jgi:hypothetical protein
MNSPAPLVFLPQPVVPVAHPRRFLFSGLRSSSSLKAYVYRVEQELISAHDYIAVQSAVQLAAQQASSRQENLIEVQDPPVG